VILLVLFIAFAAGMAAGAMFLTVFLLTPPYGDRR
jgi:hypothetical protein